MSQTPQPSTIPADHSPTITKFSSCIASNVQAICVAFTNFKQFYLHSLWTGEENVTVKTATGIFNRYALNIYTIYTKPRLIASSALHVESPRIRIPHAHDYTNIKTHCPDKSHPCSTHPLPLPLIQEGSEEQIGYFWPRNHSKRTQQPMTNYHQLLEQWDRPFLLWGFPPTHILGQTNHIGAELEPPDSRGCRPASRASYLFVYL